VRSSPELKYDRSGVGLAARFFVGRQIRLALVAQGIERRPPEAEAQVRFLPRALTKFVARVTHNGFGRYQQFEQYLIRAFSSAR
jgi:hypothetical protein